MIALAIALVGAALVAAVWDAFRRALASQVRLAELRVEAMRRADVEELDAAVRVLRADVEKLRGDLGSLETATALGRRGR
jgi:hypothetical protein